MRRIEYDLGLFRNEAERGYSEAVFRLLLSVLANADLLYLRTHYPIPSIYSGVVRYEREPLGQEKWKGISACIRDGFADCEDLACWRTAELAHKGIRARPAFWRRVHRTTRGKINVYHVVVLYPDGRIEDPSRRLGMGRE